MSDAQDQRGRHRPVPDGEARRRNRLDADRPEVAKQKRGGEAGHAAARRTGGEARRVQSVAHRPTRSRSSSKPSTPIPPTIEGNREMLAWLRGERPWYDETEKRHRRVTLIDFEHTDANVFHVSWEWTLKPPARKGNRADVMFLVNGVPVCIVEHKNPKDGDAIERGIKQLRRYENRNARADRRAAALQRHAPARLLVRRDLERDAPRHGALEADAAMRPIASRFKRSSSAPTSCGRSSTGFCST